MIVYKNTLSGFFEDVRTREIIDKIEFAMGELHIGYDSVSEERAWLDSTRYMKEVLKETNLPNDVCVFIEYNVPFTSSRIDFCITGLNENEVNTAIIVEMKGWSKGVELSEKEGMVYADFYRKDVLLNYQHPFHS